MEGIFKQGCPFRHRAVLDPFCFFRHAFYRRHTKGRVLLYPPGIIFVLFDFSSALKIYVAAHFIIMGLFTYALLRELKFSPAPAVGGAFVLLFNSFTATKVNFLSRTRLTRFFPCCRLLMLRYFTRRGLHNWMFFIFSMVLILMAGHPPTLAYTAMFLFAFWLYCLSEFVVFRFTPGFLLKGFLLALIFAFFFISLSMPQLGFFSSFSRSTRWKAASFKPLASSTPCPT